MYGNEKNKKMIVMYDDDHDTTEPCTAKRSKKNTIFVKVGAGGRKFLLSLCKPSQANIIP